MGEKVTILLRQFTAGLVRLQHPAPAASPCEDEGSSPQRIYLCIKSLLHSLSPAASTLYLHQVPWLVNNAASFLTPPYDPDEFLDVLCDCSPLFFSNSLFFILGFHPSSVLNPRHIQIKSWVQISLACGTAGLKSYSKYMSANVCICVCACTYALLECFERFVDNCFR